MTHTISSEGKFEGSIFNSKEFEDDSVSISETLILHDELLEEIGVGIGLEERLVEQEEGEEEKMFPEISMIEGFSTILVLDEEMGEEDEIDLDLDGNLNEDVAKVKKRKRTKNK